MATSLDLSAILGQATESYLKLPLIQKILFPLIIVGSVAGIIFVSKWANRPEYVTLYSDLSPADSGIIVKRLKDLKVKYEVRDGGSVIAITPPDMVDELRMTLASEGLPQGGSIGFEIFDNTNLGATSFQEKIKFMRALQGELERTISSLESVETARVHLNLPEKSLFAKQGGGASASVMLKLMPGAELTKKNIKGIAHLVAGSVEGLSIENVSIIDEKGRLLTSSEDSSEDILEAEATRVQYQQAIERSYATRIEQMLAKVLGQGKAIAKVTAELDFSASEKEEEVYDPVGAAIRSARKIKENTSAATRGGVPGVVSNLEGDQKLLAPPNSATNGRSEEVINYEVSKAVSRVSFPRGRLVRLSVAVLVDGKHEKIPVEGGAEGETKDIYRPLEPQVLDKIESLVKSAVGFDPIRGDTVTVENIPFSEPEFDFTEQLEAKATQDLIFNIIFKAGPVIFIILFFLFIIKPLIKFLTTPTEAEVDLERLLPTGIQELEKEIEVEKSKVKIPETEPAVDLDQLEELMSENSRIVKENPQQAALLIRYWLNDGRL